MSSLFACAAPTSWMPFSDPSPENIETMLQAMKTRIAMEEWHANLRPTEYETHPNNLERFLQKHYMDLEVALNQWHRWVQWRHDMEVDAITDDVVKHEMAEGVFQWRGKNKAGMHCCVITGRMMDPEGRQGTYSSFKKYLVRLVDDGMKLSNEEQDKICIIYDRRGLDYKHIDPNLHQFCRRLVDELKDFYSDRIGVVYVLHTNWLYYMLYSVVLWPILSLWSKSGQFIVLEEPDDLLEHFDEDQLFLLSDDTAVEEETGTEEQSTTEVVKEGGDAESQV